MTKPPSAPVAAALVDMTVPRRTSSTRTPRAGLGYVRPMRPIWSPAVVIQLKLNVSPAGVQLRRAVPWKSSERQLDV